jgi:molybdate transport system substrate-binding protein
MKKLLSITLAAFMLAAVMAGCASNEPAPPTEKTELYVMAAASMTDVLTEFEQMYEAENENIDLTLTFASSGALQSQIEEGAPADIFMSAAQKQMKALEEKDLILADTKKNLLLNKVVLIAPADSKLGLTSFEDLTKDEVKKIGLGDPASVPVGQYSEEIFTTLNILDAVTPKAVYGSSVRDVLTWVESGETDCGVVYSTDAATTDKVSVVCQAPEGSHKTVSYPVAVLKSSKNADAAKAFLDYISTDDAAKVFEKYGFEMYKE